MKRIIALTLTFIMLFTLSACGKDKEKPDTYSVDVNYYANLGAIPEVEYKLGANIDDMLTALEAEETANAEGDDHQHATYTVYEEAERSMILTSGTNYYYDTKDKDGGVSYIVNFDASYGFALGTYSIEVKDALSTLKLEAQKREPSSDEVFFIPGSANLTVLEYNFKKCNLMFIFQEDMLCATALYK